MQKKNVVETLVGAAVLGVAGCFMLFAYQTSDVKVANGYDIKARFANATGLNPGSDVRIGGVKIGTVSDMTLDPNTFEAVISMTIGKALKIPADSTAAISSSGLLGEKFVQLTPGADEKTLNAGETLQFTQSSVSLEEMIGKFMFSGGGVDGENKKAGKPAQENAPADGAVPHL